MNTNFFRILAFTSILFFSCLLTASAEYIHPVVAVLSDKYGNVLSKNLEGIFEFTVSADFSEVENILELATNQEWFIKHISITSREDGKAAIIFKASQQKNSSEKKFATLQNILKPGMLIWKTSELPDDMAVVTTIETSFDSKINIAGATKKSGLIFSHLFPMIERINGLNNPFFSKGTYSDSKNGRIMNFVINCDW